MSVDVRIPTTLRTLTGGANKVTVEGSTVSEVLAALDAAHPGFASRLLDDSGAIQRFVNVFVADDVLPAPPAKMMHGPGPKDFVKALEVAVPLLTAEQREALADRLEAGPAGRHGKGKMGARKEAN